MTSTPKTKSFVSRKQSVRVASVMKDIPNINKLSRKAVADIVCEKVGFLVTANNVKSIASDFDIDWNPPGRTAKSSSSDRLADLEKAVMILSRTFCNVMSGNEPYGDDPHFIKEFAAGNLHVPPEQKDIDD